MTDTDASELLALDRALRIDAGDRRAANEATARLVRVALAVAAAAPPRRGPDGVPRVVILAYAVRDAWAGAAYTFAGSLATVLIDLDMAAAGTEAASDALRAAASAALAAINQESVDGGAPVADGTAN
mgnify:FL=1